MLTQCDSISFVATRDPAESRDFYENRLGLTFVSDEHFALVFEMNCQSQRTNTCKAYCSGLACE